MLTEQPNRDRAPDAAIEGEARMTVPSARLTWLALTLTALATAGCNEGILSGAGHADELTSDIGVTMRDEVESSLSSLTLASAIAPLGTTQAATGTASPVAAPCVSPSSATDSDGDGVPDDATYLFTAPPCRFTVRGGTLDIVGSLRIQDPFPTNAGFGYDATLTELRSLFISADGKTIQDVRRNGTRTLSGSVSGLLLTAELQVKRTFTGHSDANIDKQWTVNFTPATPLQINTPLPSGALDIAGTVAWNRGTENFDMVVTTPTPLQYDASCADTPQRIRAGELNAAGTFGEMTGFVRVTWSGCGTEPRFSFESTE
jgi:hypothetical protein